MKRTKQRSLDAPLKVLEILTSVLLFIMMVLTFVDVLGRYLVSAPIYGAAEMIQFLLAATIFSAMGLASDGDTHISVELFSPKLETMLPRFQPAFVTLASVAGLLLIGFELGRSGIESWLNGKTTIVLEWPIAVIALLSSAFCLFAALVQIVRYFEGRK